MNQQQTVCIFAIDFSLKLQLHISDWNDQLDTHTSSKLWTLASETCGGHGTDMGVSKNRGFYPQIMNFNRVFHYFHHPFWGFSSYFWKHPHVCLAFFFCFPLNLLNLQGSTSVESCVQTIRARSWRFLRWSLASGVTVSNAWLGTIS